MPVADTIWADSASVNLLTWGTGTVYQFAAWYTLAGEIKIGRIVKGTDRWGVDHDEIQLGGTPRTALAMPRTDDEHNYIGLAVDGLGRIHVWANMHSAPMRAVKTVDPHTSDTWLADSGWVSAASDFPGTNADVTYPNPNLMPDGTVVLYIRDSASGGGSGRADSHLWTRGPSATTWTGPTLLFQGLEVPDAKGPGVPGDTISVDSEFNWSAYETGPLLCESTRSPHPGRLHMMWLWRLFALDGERNNVLPSYAYSDDTGATWKAVDGTSATLPITPLNNHNCRFPGHGRFTSINRDGGLVVGTLDQTHASAGILQGQSYVVQVPADPSLDGTFTIGAVGDGTTFGTNQILWSQGGATVTVNLSGYIGVDDYVNTQSVAVDEDGRPHIVFSHTPSWWWRWTGATWERSQVPSSINGVTWQGTTAWAFWHRHNLWLLKGFGGPISRKPTALNLGGPGVMSLGGPVYPFGGHDASLDPEAYRRFGTIEVLTPDGDIPRVTVLGHGPRARAA